MREARGHSRFGIVRLLAALFVLGIGSLVVALEPPDREREAAIDEITPEHEQAVRDGLAFLARTQHRDGSWAGGDYTVAVTSLAGLAFLGAGFTADAGPYAERLRAAIAFLLRSQTRTGLIALSGDQRPMYGHGFALLFLAQSCGEIGEPVLERSVAEAIRRGVREIERSQSPDGGWYYTPGSGDDEGSVTITQIQALRAARNAGFAVGRAVIERAIDYIRRSQDPDGGVRYTVRSGRSSLALTAAGMAVLQGAGAYESPELQKALKYVRHHLEVSGRQPHFSYTHFYLGQALYQQGGADWAAYYPRIRDEILRRRRVDGAWDSSYGRAYASAMALLVLEIPYRYLPIYTR